MRLVLGSLLAFTLCLSSSAAAAQRPHARGVVVLQGDGPIHGQVQRPAAVTILPRARLRHRRAERRAHFLPEVARSVQRRPF